MNEKKYGKFVQFPLCMIASTDIQFSRLLFDALSYGIVNFLDKTRDEGKPAFYNMDSDEKEKAHAKSRSVIGFSGGGAEDTHKESLAADGRRQFWTGRNGSTCEVRFRTDLLFESARGDISEREARVLLGLYSAIGDKPYVKATWQAIQHRAAGWVRPIARSARSNECGPKYSRHQIDRTLLELMERGLVVGATYNRGERFWTNKLTVDELWKHISARKIKQRSAGSSFQKLNAERSKALMETLEKGATPVAAPS